MTESEEVKIHADESVKVELDLGKPFFQMGDCLDVFIGGEEVALGEGKITKIQTGEQGLFLSVSLQGKFFTLLMTIGSGFHTFKPTLLVFSWRYQSQLAVSLSSEI